MTFEGEWARCAPWVQAALDHAGGTHSLDDVRAMVERREARFWAGRDCAVITQIIDYPRFRALHIWLGGGDIDELIGEMVPLMEAWARDERGCRTISLTGRPGWERAMRAGGYQPVARVLMKELTL